MSDYEPPLVKHARRELQMAGTFAKTEDYDGSIGRGTLAVMKMIQKWSNGDNAKVQAIALAVEQLAGGGLLSPPTTNPLEWVAIDGQPVGYVRNVRNPYYVSTDHGFTWTHLQTQEKGASKKYEEVTDGEASNDNTSDSSRGSDGEAESTGVEGRELDPGVAQKGSEDPRGAQSAATESEGGQA